MLNFEQQAKFKEKTRQEEKKWQKKEKDKDRYLARKAEKENVEKGEKAKAKSQKKGGKSSVLSSVTEKQKHSFDLNFSAPSFSHHHMKKSQVHRF